jgi:hypothetical protein
MTRGQCGSLYLSLCKTFTHYSLPVSRRTLISAWPGVVRAASGQGQRLPWPAARPKGMCMTHVPYRPKGVAIMAMPLPPKGMV